MNCRRCGSPMKSDGIIRTDYRKNHTPTDADPSGKYRYRNWYCTGCKVWGCREVIPRS